MLRLAPSLSPTVLVVSVASLGAAVVCVLIMSANWVISLPIVLGIVFPLVLYASRNPRLFFLVGMVFTAPLGLSINLVPHQHMGGAHAYSINLMDFFMLPLLVFLARDFYLGYRRDLRFSAISWWWLGLIVLGLSTVVVGPFREMAALEVVRMIKLWLLFLVVINECVRQRHFHFVVMGLAANAVVNILVAFAEFALKHDLGLQPLGEGSVVSTLGANIGVFGTPSDVYRVSGLAGHANLFGPYLAMLLPLFTSQMYAEYSGPIKVALGAIVGGGLICLGLTLSRSGWLSFAVSGSCLMVALFALPELRRRHIAMKVAMVSVSFAVLALASGVIIQRFTESDPGAFDFRIEWMKVAWRMVLEKPVFGLGLNSFIYNLADYSPYSIAKMTELFGDVFPVVHNVYMIVWSEQGTIGLLLFLGMHANILWIALENLRYRGLSDRIYLINLAAACGVLAIMVDGMSSFFVRVQATARVFWIVVGLVVAANYWNRRNNALRSELARQVPRVPP